MVLLLLLAANPVALPIPGAMKSIASPPRTLVTVKVICFIVPLEPVVLAVAITPPFNSRVDCASFNPA